MKRTLRKWTSRMVLFLMVIIAIAMIIGAIYLLKVTMIVDRQPIIEIPNDLVKQNVITGLAAWIGGPLLIVGGLGILEKIFRR